VDIKPSEWASGDIVWIIAAAGDPRAVPKLLKQMNETDFKGRRVRLRVRGADGKSKITTLG
jgi:hemolysin-activating ACP:hemolysin acyltransferase